RKERSAFPGVTGNGASTSTGRPSQKTSGRPGAEQPRHRSGLLRVYFVLVRGTRHTQREITIQIRCSLLLFIVDNVHGCESRAIGERRRVCAGRGVR
ncbi:unnamed protein product, partial [Laminaria digitata]